MNCFCILWALLALGWATTIALGDEGETFKRQVEPILKKCVRCHSGDTPSGGLRLTDRSKALRGGESGPAITPGDPAKSLLISMTATQKMPPKKPLTNQEVETLRQWIASGAVWEGTIQRKETTDRAGSNSWALQPLRDVAVNPIHGAANPIDVLVRQKLSAVGLASSPPADRTNLIRRATLDLIGLPPSPAEVDAFVHDPSPDAYERLLDRLLASPHYGERWARHWLDLARFCESQGYERDKLRDHSWRYRDWVIRAFNEDIPYNQFVRLQIAGDVMEPVTADRVTAVGFLIAGPWDEVGHTAASPSVRARAREEEMEDIIGLVSQTFLGLTANCARCHDHKFDPIPQRDYYQLKAVFDGVTPGDRVLLAPAQATRWTRRLEEYRHQISIREKEQAALKNAGDESQRRRTQELARELSELRSKMAALEGVPTAYTVRPRPPGPTHILQRGDPEKPGPQVVAAGLSCISNLPAELNLAADSPEGLRRIRLAEWITRPNNPLTARVMVNRVWHYHFGRGIVGTPNDFGFNGERPTHPELLDLLASTFIRQGWSIKRLHRLIMLSDTYRQSAQYNLRAAAVDADNHLLWRFAPRRLEGEVVRDSMLWVSGQLNPAMGGPSFRPFNVVVFNSSFYNLIDDGRPEFNRRTIYRINVNSAKEPLLDSLDCPDPSVKTPRRNQTTTPLQALGLMNSSFVLRQAKFLAERIGRDSGIDARAQIALAYRLTLGRQPSQKESDRATTVAREHGLQTVCWALLNSSEFLYLR